MCGRVSAATRRAWDAGSRSGAALGETALHGQSRGRLRALSDHALERVTKPRDVLVAGGRAGRTRGRPNRGAARPPRHRSRAADRPRRDRSAIQRAAPDRHDIGMICDWLWDELDRLGVERRLRLARRRRAGRARRPRRVIVATGSLPRRDGVQRMRPAASHRRTRPAARRHAAQVLDGDARSRGARSCSTTSATIRRSGRPNASARRGAEVVYCTSFGELCPTCSARSSATRSRTRLARYRDLPARDARLRGQTDYAVENRDPEPRQWQREEIDRRPGRARHRIRSAGRPA